MDWGVKFQGRNQKLHLGAFSLADMRKLALGRDGSGRDEHQEEDTAIYYAPIWIGLFPSLDSLLLIFCLFSSS